MGAGAAGQTGVPVSRAQRGAAGTATTRPRSTVGSPAWGATYRAKPAENHIALHQFGVCARLEAFQA